MKLLQIGTNLNNVMKELKSEHDKLSDMLSNRQEHPKSTFEEWQKMEAKKKHLSDCIDHLDALECSLDKIQA